MNNPQRKYKGTEPCPLGLGYCPRMEKIGTKMKGRDGKVWVVRKIDKGRKDWKKK